jgi:hypothetical protein
MRRPQRLAAFSAVSSQLSKLSDQRLADRVAAATPLGSGIGGRSAELEVDGFPVFVKRVPLTDLETRPENVGSTANLFDLPLFYQYGVGSSGFGAWRELAAHVQTTQWVLDQEHEGFPLMYHWRVVPDSPPKGFLIDDDLEATVARWEGSAAVRQRLVAISRSSASLVLFLEHVPQTLAAYLHERRSAASAADLDSDHGWAEDALSHTARFLSSRGMVHFDAHFHNVLTDGQLIYLADFGLALSVQFDLSTAEKDFLTAHLTYDQNYVVSHLIRHHLVAHLGDGADTETFLQNWITGRRPPNVPPRSTAILDRRGRVALVLNEFHRRLIEDSKRTPFPAVELNRAGRAEQRIAAKRPGP